MRSRNVQAVRLYRQGFRFVSNVSRVREKRPGPVNRRPVTFYLVGTAVCNIIIALYKELHKKGYFAIIKKLCFDALTGQSGNALKPPDGFNRPCTCQAFNRLRAWQEWNDLKNIRHLTRTCSVFPYVQGDRKREGYFDKIHSHGGYRDDSAQGRPVRS